MTDEMKRNKLKDLGYDEFFDLKWRSLDFKNCSVARVIAEHKAAYSIMSASGKYLAKIIGKQMLNARKREDYPAVGDWVVVSELDNQKAVIHYILPRKTILKKKYSDRQDTQIIATNIDIAFIIESLDKDYNLNRFERYLVLTNQEGIKPTIILNKTDLISEAELDQRVKQLKNRIDGIDIILTSTITKSGLDNLLNYIIKGKTYCFLGSSGVGKSSLINKLLKKDTIKIQEISNFTGKGKHTTTAREMYFLENGGIVIDNPGTREVGIADVDLGIENVFSQISLLSKNCKYADCTHLQEPGCAVLKAIENDKLDEDKYWNYIKLKKENEFYEMTDIEKKEKDRRFGKFIKKAKDQLE